MKLSQKQLIIIGAGVFFIIIAIVLIFSNLRSSERAQEVSLVFWGTEDDLVFKAITDGYKVLRPNVEVSYVQISENGYSRAILDALAERRGPDIFYIGNRDLPKEINKLSPAPTAQLGLANLRNLFPTVVEQDFVSDGSVYALPLYIDTLAMLYNKDLFDRAAIAEIPAIWSDFLKVIPALRKINSAGQVEVAAAAIGGSEKTVDAGADLLNLLMIQNGTPMMSGKTQASFFGAGVPAPGLNAFNFYLQFANAASTYFTWSDSEVYSLDSFAGGKTAVIFNYQSSVAEVKNKSPFIRVGVAPVPQTGPEANVSYAKYKGLAVSRQSRSSGWAWDFIIYMATREPVAGLYDSAFSRPPALRSLIAKKLSDPDFGVFAKQALAARSWYQADSAGVNSAFNRAIQSVLSGQANSERALRQAESEVGALMR